MAYIFIREFGNANVSESKSEIKKMLKRETDFIEVHLRSKQKETLINTEDIILVN